MSETNPSASGQTQMSLAFIKRRPDLTPEEFYHHWEKVHGPLAKPWAEKHGIVGYTQLHCTPLLNTNTTPLGPESAAVSPLADYDGCAVFEIKSFEQMAAAFEDQYYIDVIKPDEDKFIDKKFGIVRARGEVKRIL